MFAIANVKDTLKHFANQVKIKEIAETTAKKGTDFSSASGVRKEFVDRFMDSAKFVSEEEMQLVWGPVGEVLLTDAGMSLAKVTERKIIEGHFDFAIEKMKKRSYIC